MQSYIHSHPIAHSYGAFYHDSWDCWTIEINWCTNKAIVVANEIWIILSDCKSTYHLISNKKDVFSRVVTIIIVICLCMNTLDFLDSKLCCWQPRPELGSVKSYVNNIEHSIFCPFFCYCCSMFNTTNRSPTSANLDLTEQLLLHTKTVFVLSLSCGNNRQVTLEVCFWLNNNIIWIK